MNTGRTIFAQLLDLAPRHEFHRCVARYHGDRRIREFSCFDQFLALAFAQLTYRESLRDIETCLRALGAKLYHAGFRGTVARSTLADANETRDWRIYADFAHVLIGRARHLYAAEDFGVALAEPAYAFDSTTIDLCLALYPWASFRRHKAAVKLHTQLDLRGGIPCFVRVTTGKTADVLALDHLALEAGAFYVFDRGYTDFRRLHRFTAEFAYFVTRAKHNLDFRCVDAAPVDKSTGLRCDQIIRLRGPKTAQFYPGPLRRIGYYDAGHDHRLVFLSNHLRLPALTIADLFRCRWQIELFFKWIKQHLRIKAFYGTSFNAVCTQIWIALSVYVLVAILRKELRSERSLYEILQILSISLFERLPIRALITEPIAETNVLNGSSGQEPRHNQLMLFDF